MKKTKSLTAEKVASFGVFALLTIFTLITDDKYFNITSTRYIFFTVCSALCLAVCLLLKINTIDNPLSLGKPKLSSLSTADLAFLLFCFVAVISTVSSSYGTALTMSGAGGRRMGLVMIMAIYFAYIFISRFYRIREYEFIFFGAVGAFAALYGLLQFNGIDPLGFLKGLSELDSVRFISFMGNINIYSSYICLVLPLAMYMFCFSEKKLSSVFWLLVSSATFIGLMTAISDSGYLGVGTAAVVLAVVTARERKTFQRFFVIVITFLISAGVFSFMWKTIGDPEHPSSIANDIMSNPWVIITGSIISAVIIIVLNSFDFSEKFYKGIRRFIIISAVSVVAVCIGFVVWFTCFDTETDLGRYAIYLRFTERWANGRGYCWTKLIEIFKELPFHKKLIGTGPETLVYEMVSRYNDEMYELFNFYYDNAHNDVLQYLITMGLWGMLTYLMLVASAIRSCIKSEDAVQRAMLLPIVAFFAQSLVNISQPITTPLFFVFLAFTQCRSYDKEKKNTSIRHNLADTTNESDFGG